MPGSFELIQIDDAQAEEVNQALLIKGLRACAWIGSAAIGEDEYMFGLLDTLAEDFDFLAEGHFSNGAITEWETPSDQATPDDSETLSDVAERFLDDTDDREASYSIIDSSTNPLLRAAYLAYFALSHGHNIPKITERLYKSILQRLETDRVKLEQDCLSALGQDKHLQTFIAEESVGEVSTTGNAHEKIAAELGAGVVTLLVNQQQQLNQQQFRADQAHLN